MPSGATGVCGSSPMHPRDVDRPQLGDRRAVQQHRAAPRPQQPGQAAQQRRLAAGVRADDHRDAGRRACVTSRSRTTSARRSRGPGPRARSSWWRRSVAVIRRVPPGSSVASSQTRYGAPIAPVTTPVGSATGSAWQRDEIGRQNTMTAPTRPAASKPPAAGPSRRVARSVPRSAPRTGCGPAAAVANGDQHDRDADQRRAGTPRLARRARARRRRPAPARGAAGRSSSAPGPASPRRRQECAQLGRPGVARPSRPATPSPRERRRCSARATM